MAIFSYLLYTLAFWNDRRFCSEGTVKNADFSRVLVSYLSYQNKQCKARHSRPSLATFARCCCQYFAFFCADDVDLGPRFNNITEYHWPVFVADLGPSPVPLSVP